MRRMNLRITATALLLAAGSMPASAQGFDLSTMMANEIQFQDQFYSWAWDTSIAVAQQIPDDQPLPFNAMTISNSISGGMRAFEQSAAQWHVNSDRTMKAIDRYGMGAVRGNWAYSDPYNSGYYYELPYQNNYWQDQGGWIYDSYDPYRTQLQPVSYYPW